MTPQGNGPPIRYDVRMSGVVGDRLKELHREAADSGRGKAFVSAFRQIVARLQRDPVNFGEPLYRLPALRLLVCQGAIHPLVVDYAVHETLPLVFIRGVTLLP
jgi:hypothetical protein